MSYHTSVRADPVCGQCGYCVRGITSLTCPECGSDLREVGIIAPNMRLPTSKHVKALIWTFALPPAAFLISWLALSTVLPFSVKHKMDRRITCGPAYLKVALDAYAWEYPWQPGIMNNPPIHPSKVWLTDRNFNGLIETDLSSGAYHYWWGRGATVSQTSGFNGAAIANWLSGMGANPADPNVRHICDQIYKAVNDMHLGSANLNVPLLDLSGMPAGAVTPATSWTVHDEPNPVMIGVLALCWLIIWIYGFRRIYGRQKITASP
jgi:hypothetical protein